MLNLNMAKRVGKEAGNSCSGGLAVKVVSVSASDGEARIGRAIDLVLAALVRANCDSAINTDNNKGDNSPADDKT
jgi:hypothetical protein